MLVHELNAQGWEARRVPLSGGTDYAKGDVEATKHGIMLRLEKKARGNAFGSVYAAYEALKREFNRSLVTLSIDDQCIELTDVLDDLVTKEELFRLAENTKAYEVHKRGMHRLITFKQWVESADVLVLRDNHKKHLFVRYRG